MLIFILFSLINVLADMRVDGTARRNVAGPKLPLKRIITAGTQIIVHRPVKAGDCSTATHVGLFMYNAAVWSAHRMHYDETYAKEVDDYPTVVINGPLQGDLLSPVALELGFNIVHRTVLAFRL